MFTIGHSTRSLTNFIALLEKYKIKRLLDVRTIPRSRHNPQFNKGTLPIALKPAGISYQHLKGLGGLRSTSAQSINTGWENKSFRGYADYMQTVEFTRHLKELILIARKRGRSAIMCAEAVPWHCHRSLIADALTAKGICVLHIMSLKTANPHALTSFAKIKGQKIFYPPPRSIDTKK